MRCTSCGREIENGSAFCEFCGAKQAPAQAAPTVSQPAAPISQPAAPAEPKKPMSKGTKIGLIVVAVILVGGFGAKSLLTSMNDPTKTISRFIESIRAKDVAAFSKVVTLNDPDGAKEGAQAVELNETTLAPLFKLYGGDNSNHLSSLQESLQSDLAVVKAGLSADGSNGFRLVKKSNFLFDSYKVEITPVEVKLTSEFDNTTVTLNGTDYTVGTKATTVRMLPGFYDGAVSCTANTTGVKLERELENMYIVPGDREKYFSFDYSSVYLYSYYDGLTLVKVAVDGHPYTGDISEFGSYGDVTIFPVNPESKIDVTYSVSGLEFNESFTVSDVGYEYCLEPELPSDVRAAGEAMAGNVAVIVAQLRGSYNPDLIPYLTEACGNGSPDFVRWWTNYAAEQMEYYSGSYYSFPLYTGLTASSVSSDVYFNSEGITMDCSVSVKYDSYAYYWWDDYTPTGSHYGSGSTRINVELAYRNGQWEVLSSST